ncbi:MAG: alpha/beta fold hydrolase [Verrucomicrobia bacterium]|jgi:alpha/beta superfamily hydrolase|nr:alpha/beta fold hydrolase [Verrucomicrobiota bacterium]
MKETIRNTFNECLDYNFASGAESVEKPGWIVLLGHGVTGDKDRPVIVDTATALNAAGFDTLRFSFAGNGGSEGDFADATISKEAGDLNAVIEAVSPMYSNIAYIGHSMGGAVGVLQASKDPRIKALISLAGMVDTKAFAETEFGDVIPDQGLMWDEPDCPLSSQFVEDLCRKIGSVAPQAEQVRVPWLLIHGTADDVVLPKDSLQIRSIKGDSVDFISIEGADHSFSDPIHNAKMTLSVVEWLKKIM